MELMDPLDQGFDSYLNFLSEKVDERLSSLPPLQDTDSLKTALETEFRQAMTDAQREAFFAYAEAELGHWLESVKQAYRLGLLDALRLLEQKRVFQAQMEQAITAHTMPAHPCESAA